jgi:selenocysteine lyase/cysteine desulfurase
MGLNTWTAFVGTNKNAAVAGDVAMLANEVTPVLKALRANGIDVVAIHPHITDTRPAIYFLHYWATGPADKLAMAFKSGAQRTGKNDERHSQKALMKARRSIAFTRSSAKSRLNAVPKRVVVVRSAAAADDQDDAHSHQRTGPKIIRCEPLMQ